MTSYHASYFIILHTRNYKSMPKNNTPIFIISYFVKKLYVICKNHCCSRNRHKWKHEEQLQFFRYRKVCSTVLLVFNQCFKHRLQLHWWLNRLLFTVTCEINNSRSGAECFVSRRFGKWLLPLNLCAFLSSVLFWSSNDCVAVDSDVSHLRLGFSWFVKDVWIRWHLANRKLNGGIRRGQQFYKEPVSCRMWSDLLLIAGFLDVFFSWKCSVLLSRSCYWSVELVCAQNASCFVERLPPSLCLSMTVLYFKVVNGNEWTLGT